MVVIGKNFGDEGKGQTVDRLCRGRNALVIRHNGGAQAGHTVEDGCFRFVFHQLGSGSYRNCPTYWSDTFLPDLFKLEEEILDFSAERKKEADDNAECALFAHPDCRCVIIYDVLLNNFSEQLRGENKHGSCGMGIYEAVCRSRNKKYAVLLKDFEEKSLEEMVEKIRLIRDEYVIPKYQELCSEAVAEKGSQFTADWGELIFDENILMNAADIMYRNFYNYIVLKRFDEVIQPFSDIIFENAQGLMLDEDNAEYYPNLTPSHTGLYNVLELLKNVREGQQLEVSYVTRTYVTRHGAGRLDYECDKSEINRDMYDKTNTTNLWQDELRYAMHSTESFWSYIDQDLSMLSPLKKKGWKIDTRMYLTHMDETEGKIYFSNQQLNFKQFQLMCKKDRGISCFSSFSYQTSDNG